MKFIDKLSLLLEIKLKGGLGDGISYDQAVMIFGKKQVEDGIKHEMEHTNNKDIAAQIAIDHLVKDRDYYKHEH